MECLVRHHELAYLLHQRIAGFLEEHGEGAHREPFHQHLHADQLLPDQRRGDEFFEQTTQRRTHCHGLAPARLDIARERRDVARLLARLVRGVFLRAGIAQDVAEGGRQRKRALLAVQDGRERPPHIEIDELDFPLFVELLADRRFEIGVRRRIDEIFVLHVKALREVDVFAVERIPEMLMRRRNDLIEGIAPLPVALDVEHRGEIARIDGVVGGILGDVVHCPCRHENWRGRILG